MTILNTLNEAHKYELNKNILREFNQIYIFYYRKSGI